MQNIIDYMIFKFFNLPSKDKFYYNIFRSE